MLLAIEGGKPRSPEGAVTAPASVPAPPAPEPPPTLAVGLTEQNPALVAPGTVPAEFVPWRDRAAALKPRYYRLLVDWSKIQPREDAPPDWSAPNDGCLRGRPPCAPYAGLRDILRALKARQDADGGWELVATVYGAPPWVRRPAEGGCPAGGFTVRRDAYVAFLRSFAELAAQEGIALAYLAPWNEPNHPTFLGPQRATCDRTSPTLSAAAYAELARTAREVLAPATKLVLGDVAGYDRPRTNATAAAEFAAALPRDVVCSSDVWGQHAYVGRGATALAADRQAGGHAKLLAAVQAALDAHGCAEQHRIWITESGATPADGACTRMDEALRAWEEHPRVDVAVQYTFRQDTEFPVGLADTRLTRTQPAYPAWAAWGARDPAGPPPEAPCSQVG